MEEEPQEQSVISKQKEKFLKKPFMKSRLFLFLLIAGFVFNIILLVMVYLGIKPGESLFQTKFNAFYGVTETGPWQDFYYLYLTVSLVYIVNSLLAAYAFTKERIISYFLLVLNILIHMIVIFQVSTFIKLINL